MLHRCRFAALAALALAAAVAGANPGREPGPATVAVIHSDDLPVPRGLLAPASVYPLGKLNSKVLAIMTDRAVMAATGTARLDDAWRALVRPNDRVGILLDAQDPPANLGILDILIDRLVRVGVRPGSVTIWGQDERALFSAGLMVGRSDDGVSTLGADSEGYRGGVTRIILDDCDVIINLARLRPNPRLGMWGALANLMAGVPEDERRRLLEVPVEVGSAAAKPASARKFVLHILDALQPNAEPGALAMPPYWQCSTLVAGRDPVAVDRIGQQILEERRAAVKSAPWPLEPAPEYISAACTRFRVGQSDLVKITTVKHEVAAP
jgi:hypothetical protein